RERAASRVSAPAGEPSTGEEGGALPETRARQPRERVRRPTRSGERTGESEGALGDRVQGRLERERGGGTRLPGEVAPAGGHPPASPREPLDAGSRVEAERAERALERDEHARRTSQWRVPGVPPAHPAPPAGVGAGLAAAPGQ